MLDVKKNNDRQNGLSRRDLMASAAAAAVAVSTGTSTAQATTSSKKFKLKYAPHFNMFRHHAGKDHLDQIQFMADQGFSAMEDNGMMGRPVELQEKIARKMSRLGMTMGVFVAYANFDFKVKTFVTNKKDVREMLVNRMKEAIEVAKRVNAKWCTVVPRHLRDPFGMGLSNGQLYRES